MSYKVKEIFYTLQGEGAQSGRAAVFCRFAGCNLWSGREENRPDAICQICATDFVGTDGVGSCFFHSVDDLAHAIQIVWRGLGRRPFVVCTGGEPRMQLDQDLVDALHRHSAEIAIETNGTQLPPKGIDWICVSPKAGAPLVLDAGDELKLVYPQEGAEPERFERLNFRHFFLQPMDGPNREANTRLAIQYCMEHPQWRLSLQTHKMIGIP